MNGGNLLVGAQKFPHIGCSLGPEIALAEETLPVDFAQIQAEVNEFVEEPRPIGGPVPGRSPGCAPRP